LNVWTSSASTGCLKNENVSAISRKAIPMSTGWSKNVHFHASPEGSRRLMVPGIDDTTPHMFPCRRGVVSSIRKGQRLRRHQSGQRRTMEYGHDIRLGAVSSVCSHLSANCVHSLAWVSSPVNHLPILVALRILMAKSASVLRNILSAQMTSIPASVLLTDSSWPLGYT
jgi:hypothetical protein